MYTTLIKIKFEIKKQTNKQEVPLKLNFAVISVH